MGWWSEDIMGGDFPLDYKCIIFDICGVDIFTDNISKHNISDNLDDILGFVRDSKEADVEEFSIKFQVLAVLMLCTGFNISDSLKSEMIEAIKLDDWAKYSNIRKGKIDFLISSIEKYDGTPIFIESQGLFDVIINKKIL